MSSADTSMDSSYIAQDLATSLAARPKHYRQQLIKKATAPSGLKNPLTRSSSSSSVDADETLPTPALGFGAQDEATDDPPSTVKPVTRTVHLPASSLQSQNNSKLPAKVLPDALTFDHNRTNLQARAAATSSLEAEVQRLQEALTAKDEKLAAKDAEIAQLKDRLAKQQQAAKRTNSTSATTPTAGPANGLGGADFKALEQQFAQQERLLSGYQKENERATAELQLLRTRNKQMEAHLERVHGLDDWESVVFAESATPGMPKRTTSSPVMQRAKKVFEQQPSPSLVNSPSSSPATPRATGGLSESDVAGLLSHIQSVQLLVQTLDQRLKESEAGAPYLSSLPSLSAAPP